MKVFASLSVLIEKIQQVDPLYDSLWLLRAQQQGIQMYTAMGNYEEAKKCVQITLHILTPDNPLYLGLQERFATYSAILSAINVLKDDCEKYLHPSSLALTITLGVLGTGIGLTGVAVSGYHFYKCFQKCQTNNQQATPVNALSLNNDKSLSIDKEEEPSNVDQRNDQPLETTPLNLKP